MKILATSDWHLKPGPFSTDFVKHLGYIKTMADAGWRVLVLGDWIDTLEYGRQAYDLDFFFSYHPNITWLEGNHNPGLGVPSVVIDNIFFAHGHQFDLLWGWLPIYRFPVPECIRKWYRTPAQKKKGVLRDYHLSTIQIEATAAIWGVKHRYRAVVFGHDHCPLVRPFESYPEDFILANSGDRVDSFTWLEGDTETNVWRLMR